MPKRSRPEQLTQERSTTSDLKTSGTDKPTSSPASAAGRSRFASPVSQMALAFGRGAAPVSRSAGPGDDAGSRMNATYGPNGSASSKSAALQSSLESRLRLAMASCGSTLFSLTWRASVTPARRRICVLLASGRRTSDSGSTSWPTSTRMDGQSSARHGGYMKAGHSGTTLLDAARLAPWATPVSTELGNTLENYRAMKANMKSGARTAITHPSLQAQLVASGSVPTGSTASTTSGDRLSPDHSRWLQGYPATWADCAPTGTRLSRKSRRPLSEPRSRTEKKP